jgi:cell division protein FtsX
MIKFFRTVNRVIKSGIQKSGRKFYIFLPLVLFFTLVTTIGGFAYMSYGFSQVVAESFKNKVNIVVYFDRRVYDETVKQIVNQITTRSDIQKTDFTARDAALAEFKERHKSDPITLQALTEIGGNPFGSSLVVVAKDPSNYEQISKEINSMGANYKNQNINPIEYVSYDTHKEAIDGFASMLRKLDIVAGILFVILAAVLFFTMYLGLRLATESDRDEIHIMKLVGAKNLLMAGPTAVMGSLSGLVGSFISLFGLYFGAKYLMPYTSVVGNFNIMSWFMSQLQWFILGTVGFGIVFGFLGGYFAVRRYLK